MPQRFRIAGFLRIPFTERGTPRRVLAVAPFWYSPVRSGRGSWDRWSSPNEVTRARLDRDCVGAGRSLAGFECHVRRAGRGRARRGRAARGVLPGVSRRGVPRRAALGAAARRPPVRRQARRPLGRGAGGEHRARSAGPGRAGGDGRLRRAVAGRADRFRDLSPAPDPRGLAGREFPAV